MVSRSLGSREWNEGVARTLIHSLTAKRDRIRPPTTDRSTIRPLDHLFMSPFVASLTLLKGLPPTKSNVRA